METEWIDIRGAREHNLKNIDVRIPRNKLVVITGLSGSGKSSLAFDTIYAEGQRRYVECLSAYARQFLGSMERPDVDSIDGLSPAISIEQKTVSRSPRSTVGTVTEIYDYLRLLFARVGTQHCPKDGAVVDRQSQDQMVDRILSHPHGTRVMILAPVVRGRKGHYRELFEQIQKDGFTRVRIDGELTDLEPGLKVDRYKVHDIEIVVDRLVLHAESRSRVTDSLELALKFGDGVVVVRIQEEDVLMSQKQACPVCGTSYDDLAPNSFSFNSPYGACPACDGLGEKRDFDPALIVPDPSKSLNQGGIEPLGKPRSTWWWAQIRAVAESCGFDLDLPISQIPAEALHIILHGSGKQKYRIPYTHQDGRHSIYTHSIAGVFQSLTQYYHNTTSTHIRDWAESFMTTMACPDCGGGRLKPASLAVRLADTSIAEITSWSVRDALRYFTNLSLDARRMRIAEQILKEITSRLRFLCDVGLEYLTLDRSARSLSGGEAQRIRLATQIGTQLTGVLYVLDEPSIGLHQRDNTRLITSLHHLRDLGNSVIVVEHDQEMMEAADHIVDLGPGAGEFGGAVVAEGSVADLRRRGKAKKKTLKSEIATPASLTASYLNGTRSIPVPDRRRVGNGQRLVLEGATGRNLKDVTLNLPLGVLTCITGVSGSGKSSLINETLYPLLARHFYRSLLPVLPYRALTGLEHLDKVIDIDQTPIGRTPRSNPATYTGLFTVVRDLFTSLPEAKIRGYAAGRFSFNVAGGRCDACDGDGVKKIEMNFLPDVYVTCDVCRGHRYNAETLEVRYRGRSIADVLHMPVAEAVEFFADIPRIRRKLDTLNDVGLGYIRLGQQATTLSGGEAQRVKLATELSKIGTGKSLYILDEPTTGLHFEDVLMLLHVLNKLVEKGNTVVVIEHNLDVIKTADWLVDLGPDGGEAGGRIVVEGTPEDVARCADSHTGIYLAPVLRAPLS